MSSLHQECSSAWTARLRWYRVGVIRVTLGFGRTGRAAQRSIANDADEPAYPPPTTGRAGGIGIPATGDHRQRPARAHPGMTETGRAEDQAGPGPARKIPAQGPEMPYEIARTKSSYFNFDHASDGSRLTETVGLASSRFREEPHQVPVHRLFGMLHAAVLGVVAEDAGDAQGVKLGLQGRAEAGVVDALAGAGVGGKRGVGLGVEEDDGGIVGRGVSEG